MTTTYCVNKIVNTAITNWQSNWSLTQHVNTNNLSLCVCVFFAAGEAEADRSSRLRDGHL